MARPRTGKIPRNQIKLLTDRHREMARRLVVGERQCDVAHAFGISQARMSDIARSPVFMDYMNQLHYRRDLAAMDIARSVKQGASRGLELLLRILTEGTEENNKADLRTKTQVAQDLLDREGSAPRLSRTQASQQTTNLHLTSEDIEELKRSVRDNQSAKAG